MPASLHLECYLERLIYLAVGNNITAMLTLFCSPWWAAFTLFAGGAMVWFAATGFCVMANMLYWTGAEPRLNPGSPSLGQAPVSARCENCAKSDVCVTKARLGHIPPQRV